MERARMHLLAMLGHDLRTPLHSISMAALVLERGGEPRQLASRIQASSNRMQRLITQVLDMSQIHGASGLSLSPTKVALAALIEDLLDESRIAYPGVIYETAMDNSLEAEVDPYRMEQVASNLIGNARQHSPPGAPIHVSLRRDGDRALIEVRNTANPIAAPLAAQLFDPFTRAAAGIELNRSGMGLGLYIANQIVIGHRGRIAYHHDGAHVVFVVSVPLRVLASNASPD
jgi:signal transduction histidine kinase